MFDSVEIPKMPVKLFMSVPMYVSRIPNRNSPPTYLIREGRRVGKKVIKTTLLNITVLPEHVIEDMRILFRGGVAVDDPEFALKKSLYFNQSTPHGHVAAVLGTMRSLRLPGLIDAKDSRRRRLVLAMIAPHHQPQKQAGDQCRAASFVLHRHTGSRARCREE